MGHIIRRMSFYNVIINRWQNVLAQTISDTYLYRHVSPNHASKNVTI